MRPVRFCNLKQKPATEYVAPTESETNNTTMALPASVQTPAQKVVSDTIGDQQVFGRRFRLTNKPVYKPPSLQMLKRL